MSQFSGSWNRILIISNFLYFKYALMLQKEGKKRKNNASLQLCTYASERKGKGKKKEKKKEKALTWVVEL